MTSQDLKAARKLLKLSRANLGKRLGISGRTIEGYEQGRKTIPGPVSVLINIMMQGEWEK